jgi:nucleoid DNA-binding protein
MSRRLIEEVRTAGGELGSNAAAERAVQAVTNAIQKITGDGERVTIRGFGTFREQVRNQRTGRNPRTGEPVTIAARKRLVFKATK